MLWYQGTKLFLNVKFFFKFFFVVHIGFEPMTEEFRVPDVAATLMNHLRSGMDSNHRSNSCGITPNHSVTRPFVIDNISTINHGTNLSGFFHTTKFFLKIFFVIFFFGFFLRFVTSLNSLFLNSFLEITVIEIIS